MDLDLATFPIQAACPAWDDFYQALYRALGDALGVPADAVVACGGGYFGSGSAWRDRARTLRGGLRVLGTRRASYGEVVQVAYALFDDEGAPVAWSGCLDAQTPSPPTGVYWTDAGGRALPLTPAMKVEVKRLKALTPVRTPTVAPFTADLKLMGVALAPDDSLVYATDYAGVLHAWALPSGREVFTARVAARQTWLHALAVSADGALVAAGRRAVAVVDARTGAVRHKLAGPRKAEVNALAFSPDGRLLAAAAGRNVRGADNGVTLWDLSTGALVRAVGLDAMATALAFEDVGATLVVGTEGPVGACRVDVATGAVTARASGSGWMFDSMVATDAGWCGADLGGAVSVRDPATLAETARYTPDVALAARVWLAPAPDRRHLVATSVSGRAVAVLDAATGRLVRALPLPDFEGDIMGVACGARRCVAATGTRVTVWDL